MDTRVKPAYDAIAFPGTNVSVCLPHTAPVILRSRALARRLEGCAARARVRILRGSP